MKKSLTTLLVALIALQRLHAAGPFTVNTTTDSHAISPGSSANDVSGNVSLRSAIEAANAQSGATIINVPGGAYNLTLGELDVAPHGGKTITISGAGAATTIVAQTDGLNRVLAIDYNSAGNTIVGLSAITIQGGLDGLDQYGGAGILAGSYLATPKDVLTLSNCVVQNNHCASANMGEDGGGISMVGGDLNLTACSFTGNSSGESSGGGIVFFSPTMAASLNVTNCTFSSNSMNNTSGSDEDGGGGAIMIQTGTGSVVNLNRCTFTNNFAYDSSGGAVEFLGGTTNINGSTYTVGGTANISASTFVANGATADPVGGFGGNGGAVNVDVGTVLMDDSTVVNNSSDASGGGIYMSDVLTVNNCTVVNNSAAYNGGGIYFAEGLLNLINTIVCDNMVAGSPNNIPGYYTSATTCLLDVDPQLSPLGDYGGPTLTMPPLPGSPAIDAGSPTTLATDQRGFPRSVNGQVAIGAVELQPAVAATLPASNLALFGVTLNASITANDLTNTWYFEYGLTTNYGSFSPTNTMTPNFHALTVTNNLTGLATNTTYHYQVLVDDGMNLTTGGDMTFTTLGGNVVTPPLLTITYAGNQAIVSWPSPSTGWTLQTNGNLTTGAWANYGGVVGDNGIIKTETNSPPAGTLFFRLKQ